ncbi:hypothetical protein A3A39_03820 [Candidatus Kaiserbacteria bacterium RIFCSPLOWO2_01_FULL_54_13]|uniref:Uncharacterized protein n=1 Tax=Candidatus Kaiserbacteria bacterium RIFCSPLOWO2_01_FULL_54_13 TaxID=1798512 RepID=A0A1F6F259_9BACT|nr:MAG: hypothetical protein A3A39_03820 [Candidatus Kaiserbacteria bacterium RIFCSPLOWO2_01_FULL_54_13]
MENFQLLASPWWVNLGVFVPVASFFLWRRYNFEISWARLLYAGLFGIAFGVNEAVVVVYLRAATDLLSGFEHGLAGTVESLSAYEQMQLLNAMPVTLVSIELVREAATLIILATVACAVARRIPERWALFLWMFAFWDIFYYIGLWIIVYWPPSLLTQDVLFLIPVPWIAQVWFPILVSILCIGAVALARTDKMQP